MGGDALSEVVNGLAWRAKRNSEPVARCDTSGTGNDFAVGSGLLPPGRSRPGPAEGNVKYMDVFQFSDLGLKGMVNSASVTMPTS